MQRFTLDGSPELEAVLHGLAQKLTAAVQAAVPASRLEALVLGGGYGRGEGGVLQTAKGHRPYNDFESYVFLRGNRLVNERRYSQPFRHIEMELSRTGLHVELKLDSLPSFANRAVSMFSYDLVSAHRVLVGASDVFRDCAPHRCAANIPLAEATRLLFNRCSGLLLVRERLSTSYLTDEDTDFIGRNIAKAKLALGDAVLTVAGQYHWSVRERHRRLQRLSSALPVPNREVIIVHHRDGMEFKFHPSVPAKTKTEFDEELKHLCRLSSDLWLWVEARRLDRPFASVHDYALDDANKCPETPVLRNCLLNLRRFGARGLLAGSRYPRERLLNSLPLLLWNGEVSREPRIRRYLRRQLQTDADDWQGLVTAYKQIWPAYG
jgi:hypothetical protein